MLITVYQLKHKRFVPVQEYYWWNVTMSPEEELNLRPLKEPCPGCGKPFTKYVLRTEHVCSGSLTDRPANNMCYVKNRRWNPIDRKSTRLNSSHIPLSRMPSSA